MQTSLIMQEMSQTGNHSIFASGVFRPANIDSSPVWDISCIIDEVGILHRAIASDQS